MARFCRNCGMQMGDGDKCPHCGYMLPAKKLALRKRGIIALVLAAVLLVGSTAGYFALSYQAKAVTVDDTEHGSASGASPEQGQDQGQMPEPEGTAAVLNPNVIVFDEEDAAQINEKITDLQITNKGLYLNMAQGTAFDELSSGDIFFLEGSEDTPLGETYIGKIVESAHAGDETVCLIETPMVDEVFDVLQIDYEEQFTAEDIKSIETIEGVTVEQGEAATAASWEAPRVTTLANSSAPQITPLTDSGDSGPMLKLNVDLLEQFNLKEEGKIEFGVYEDDEGDSVAVYVTNTGEKYHRGTCRYLHSSKIETTLRQAVIEDYEPCVICVPPVLKSKMGQLETSLTLEGRVGLESLDYGVNYDWDILNGGGLEQFDAWAKGNFVTEVTVNASMGLELGGEPTTLNIPIGNVKLQGLEEKLFPIAFVTYNGVAVDVSVFPGNGEINAKTSVMPLTVGAMIYVDISGNLTVDATASFSFNYGFDCSYTAIENGQWVNRWESSAEPTFQTKLGFEAAGDLDAHLGCSVLLYVFNLNVAEIAVAKVGFEAEGALDIQHETQLRKASDNWEASAESEISGSLYGRVYLKVLEINIRLKTRIKVWEIIDTSSTLNFHYLWKDFTIAQWGERNDTRFDSATMSYSSVTAKDRDAIYYKDINGALIKEEQGYRTVLFEQDFFSICGIDSSYLYLLIPNDEKYEIRRVAKDGSADRAIAEDVALQLAIDDTYLYYVSTFDATTIMRMDRQTQDTQQFATFDYEVRFMAEQDDGYYVVAEEGGIVASFFGGDVKYYQISRDGEIVGDYGKKPTVNQYYLGKYDTYYQAAKMVDGGYLRGVAAEIYWMSGDRTASVKAESIDGWNAKDQGIFAIEKADDGVIQMILYRAEDGMKVPVTKTVSDQAFFTMCQGDSGRWYFFDQDEESLILYSMAEDFSSKGQVKRFSLEELPCNLTDCAMTIMDNTIYFYTMPNDTTSQVLYRYNILN